MPAGPDAVRDERRRLANVLTSIAASELWTALRTRDGSVDGASAARTDAPVRLREAAYLRRLDDPDFDEDVQRRFQVHVIAVEPMRRAYSGQVEDIALVSEILIGYEFTGGDRLTGDLAQCQEAAIQDAERVRQKIEHPSNRTAGGATGVSTGRTVAVAVQRIDLRTPEGRDRMVAVLTVRSELRVTTEAP